MGLVSKCLAYIFYVPGWCALLRHTKGNTESMACQIIVICDFLQIARNDDLWYHKSRQEYCIG
jgi:hypothetical protein